jgi:hypothetical protein
MAILLHGTCTAVKIFNVCPVDETVIVRLENVVGSFVILGSLQCAVAMLGDFVSVAVLGLARVAPFAVQVDGKDCIALVCPLVAVNRSDHDGTSGLWVGLLNDMPCIQQGISVNQLP